MEVALAALSTQQALAERVAMQPVPRTYDVFSRYLVHLYVVLSRSRSSGRCPATAGWSSRRRWSWRSPSG